MATVFSISVSIPLSLIHWKKIQETEIQIFNMHNRRHNDIVSDENGTGDCHRRKGGSNQRPIQGFGSLVEIEVVSRVF